MAGKTDAKKSAKILAAEQFARDFEAGLTPRGDQPDFSDEEIADMEAACERVGEAERASGRHNVVQRDDL